MRVGNLQPATCNLQQFPLMAHRGMVSLPGITASTSHWSRRVLASLRLPPIPVPFLQRPARWQTAQLQRRPQPVFRQRSLVYIPSNGRLFPPESQLANRCALEDQDKWPKSKRDYSIQRDYPQNSPGHVDSAPPLPGFFPDRSKPALSDSALQDRQVLFAARLKIPCLPVRSCLATIITRRVLHAT